MSLPVGLRRGQIAGLLLATPLLLVFAIAFVVPLGESFVTSFHPNTPAGIDSGTWTLGNYGALNNPYYLAILGRTLRLGVEVTVITTILAYPVALFVAGSSRLTQTLMGFAYVAPWFVNVAVKALGWTFLLSPHGLINNALTGLGLTQFPLRLMNNELGILIGLVHLSLVLLVLPLTAAIQGIDPHLATAARNLGARRGQVFWLITFPLTIPTLGVGVTIVFLLATTAYATPTLLGGAATPMVAFLAFQTNLVKLDWPLGAAMAVGFLAVILLVLALLQIVTRRLTRWSAP